MKELPKSISERLTNVSSSKEIFCNTTQIYEAKLTLSGYNAIITLTETPTSFGKESIEEKKKAKIVMNLSALFEQRESKCW